MSPKNSLYISSGIPSCERRESDRTFIDASGVFNSCDTFAENSFLILATASFSLFCLSILCKSGVNSSYTSFSNGFSRSSLLIGRISLVTCHFTSALANASMITAISPITGNTFIAVRNAVSTVFDTRRISPFSNFTA